MSIGVILSCLGIGVALQSRVAPFIVNGDVNTDIQPRSTRVLSVPEFFAEYRDSGNGYAAFLGTSITAKVSHSKQMQFFVAHFLQIIFSESSGNSYVSKIDYTNKGPHSIVEMTPALL